MHPFIGPGPDDRRRILSELGLGDADELFASIPDAVKVERIDLADGLDETSVLARMAALAGADVAAGARPCFLGAGAYRHVQPAVVDGVLGRAEFLTSYTPYQPEISQGTLQAIFEFQTLICQLTGLDVANASLYDGATAVVEAALMAHRVLRGRRNTVVVAETVHPLYRRVLAAYLEAVGSELETVQTGADGRVDPDALAAAIGDDGCCAIVQSPSFVGTIEDLPAIARAVHGAGALAVEAVTEATSFGLLTGGGEHGFDIVCGEAQSFGLPLGFGGPHLGFFAARDEHKRQMPGRLAGQTVDGDGRRAFCLTLSTREQHIRRAKATSNICTNHGLMALAATVWLELIGGAGLCALARTCYSRSEELKRRVAAVDGWALAYPDTPTYNEVLVTGPGAGAELAERLHGAGVLGGVPARRWGGSWPDGLLVASTELNSAADLDALVAAMEGGR